MSLIFSIEQWTPNKLMAKAREAYMNQNDALLDWVDSAVEEYFVISILDQRFDLLPDYSQEIVNFLKFARYNRTENSALMESVFASWETIWHLSELIMENTSPAYAIQSIEIESLQKSNGTGAMIVKTLYNRSGLKVTEIADKIGRKKQQVSASLIRLDELGVVTRRRAGREVFVSLTSLGRIVSQKIQVDVERKIEQFPQVADVAVKYPPKEKFDKIYQQKAKLTDVPSIPLDMAAG